MSGMDAEGMTTREPRMKEAWRLIPGCDGYAVSSSGRVLGLRGFVLSASTNNRGYKAVQAGGKLRTVHRLVAAAFLGPCPASKQVNHKDCDKANNRIDNLEYVTQLENNQHAIRSGRRAKRHRNSSGCTQLASGRWQSQIWRDGTNVYLGTFCV